MTADPDLIEAQVNAVLERAGSQLRELLHASARALDPFPSFPGALFTLGIELEGMAPTDERGCVIVGEDGELYELQLGLDVDALAAGANEPALSREETRVALEGLSPGEYVSYAQTALRAIVARLRR
ncbi:MAG: hypothetical protein U0360_07685 [Dehalococcoidia bacterium]